MTDLAGLQENSGLGSLERAEFQVWSYINININILYIILLNGEIVIFV